MHAFEKANNPTVGRSQAWSHGFMASGLTLSLTAGALLASPAVGQAIAADQTIQAAASKPNIIVILSDDMGYTDTSPYGSEIATPNLQKLADGGLRYTDFYVTPRCSTSRASLMTGQYNHAVGMGHLTGSAMGDNPGYANDLNTTNNLTLGEMLQTAGYSTQALGKWHLTNKKSINAPEANKYNWPLQRGFDDYYGTILGAGSFFDPGVLVRGNTPVSPFGASEQAIYDKSYYTVDAYTQAQAIVAADPTATPSNDYYHFTDAISDQAVSYINGHFTDTQTQDKPLFQYVAYTSAHWPLHALPEDAAMYDNVYDAGYEAIRQERFANAKAQGLVPQDSVLPAMDLDNWNQMSTNMQAYEIEQMKAYAGMVSQMDRGIGKIMDALEANGQLDNTLILYMQDNGANHEGNFSPNEAPNNIATRSDAPTLAPVDPEFILNGNKPQQTRDGYVVRGPNGGNPVNDAGAPDTYEYVSQQWGNVSNTPFQDYKSDTGEGGIASPLIAYWGQGIAEELRGSLVTDPSHLIDIMATLVDVSGGAYNAGENGLLPLPGVSLTSNFDGNHLDRDAPIFFEHEGWRAVRDGDWKLMAQGPGGAWELYNMANDRAELNNLAGDNIGVVSQMASQWEGWAYANQVLPWPWQPAYDGTVVVPNTQPVLHMTLDVNQAVNGTVLADNVNPLINYTFTANDTDNHVIADNIPAGLGQALRFTSAGGDSDMIRINEALVPHGTEARTFALWVNVESVNNTDDNRLFAYENGGGQGNWLALTFDDTDNDGQDIESIRLRYSGSHAYEPLQGDLAMGEWFHLALVMDENTTAGDVKLYIDGELADILPSGTLGLLLDTAQGDLGIGRRPGTQGQLGFNGQIADFQLYNTALSSEDVQALYANPGQLVPEPATLTALGLLSTGTLLRRRR